MALQEQSTLVKRFLDVKKTLEAGEINTGNFPISFPQTYGVTIGLGSNILVVLDNFYYGTPILFS